MFREDFEGLIRTGNRDQVPVLICSSMVSVLLDESTILSARFPHIQDFPAMFREDFEGLTSTADLVNKVNVRRFFG